jgi:hypothetical protein
MAELTLDSRPVGTVFVLLGSKEDELTYSVGWGLAQSEVFARGRAGSAAVRATRVDLGLSG